MIQQLSAIYENGLLRPLNNPNLPEKSQVNLVIETNLNSSHPYPNIGKFLKLFLQFFIKNNLVDIISAIKY